MPATDKQACVQDGAEAAGAGPSTAPAGDRTAEPNTPAWYNERFLEPVHPLGNPEFTIEKSVCSLVAMKRQTGLASPQETKMVFELMTMMLMSMPGQHQAPTSFSMIKRVLSYGSDPTSDEQQHACPCCTACFPVVPRSEFEAHKNEMCKECGGAGCRFKRKLDGGGKYIHKPALCIAPAWMASIESSAAATVGERQKRNRSGGKRA